MMNNANDTDSNGSAASNRDNKDTNKEQGTDKVKGNEKTDGTSDDSISEALSKKDDDQEAADRKAVATTSPPMEPYARMDWEPVQPDLLNQPRNQPRKSRTKITSQCGLARKTSKDSASPRNLSSPATTISSKYGLRCNSQSFSSDGRRNPGEQNALPANSRKRSSSKYGLARSSPLSSSRPGSQEVSTLFGEDTRNVGSLRDSTLQDEQSNPSLGEHQDEENSPVTPIVEARLVRREEDSSSEEEEVLQVAAVVETEKCFDLSSAGAKWLCFGVLALLVAAVLTTVLVSITEESTERVPISVPELPEFEELSTGATALVDLTETVINDSVDLIGNAFVVAFGRSFAVTTKEIFIDGNGLTGTIPTSLGLLTELTSLHLENNLLTGFLPTELGSLRSLTDLSLLSNSLSGSLPTELALLTALEWLGLGYNTLLTGTIPTEYGRLSSLYGFWVDGNSLTGTILTDLRFFSRLDYLSLGSNSLTGTIPTELSLLSTVSSVGLGLNSFTGTIPTQLGRMTALTALGLDDNSLTSYVPSELGLLTNLEGLFLEKNAFGERIPSEIGLLTELSWLYLFDNNFTGSVPLEICSLTQENKLNDISVDCEDVLCPSTCTCSCSRSRSR